MRAVVFAEAMESSPAAHTLVNAPSAFRMAAVTSYSFWRIERVGQSRETVIAAAAPLSARGRAPKGENNRGRQSEESSGGEIVVAQFGSFHDDHPASGEK